MTEETKICTSCGIPKSIIEFYIYHNVCKKCSIEKLKEYKNLHKNDTIFKEKKKERKKNAKKRWRLRYPEKYKEEKHRNYLRHKEEILLKEAKRREKNGCNKWNVEWYNNYKSTNNIAYKDTLEKKRIYTNSQTQELTDQYIKKLIQDNYKIKGEIPKGLIESYRLQIKVNRLLKTKNNGNKESLKTGKSKISLSLLV